MNCVKYAQTLRLTIIIIIIIVIIIAGVWRVRRRRSINTVSL